ncbi:hypothetical protein [Streptomyces sp. NPDC127072]
MGADGAAWWRVFRRRRPTRRGLIAALDPDFLKLVDRERGLGIVF